MQITKDNSFNLLFLCITKLNVLISKGIHLNEPLNNQPSNVVFEGCSPRVAINPNCFPVVWEAN